MNYDYQIDRCVSAKKFSIWDLISFSKGLHETILETRCISYGGYVALTLFK